MLEKGQTVKVRIQDIGSQGQGIAKVGTLALFVEGALLGDLVECEITDLKKNYAKARISSMIKPSPYRVESYCKYSEECGGCPLAGLSYEKQLEWKENTVTQSLRRIGKFDRPKVRPIIGMEVPLAYRNKVEMSVDRGKIGFYSRKSKQLVDCRDCPIQHPVSNIVAGLIRTYLEEGKLVMPLERVLIRLSERRGEVAVGFKVQRPMGKDELGQADLGLVADLEDKIASLGMSLASCMLIHGQGKEEKTVCIAGQPRIHETIGHIDLEASIQSFLQTNFKLTESLYDIVKAKVRPKKEEVLIDLYCGVGSIGLYCADQAGYVLGVERVDSAIIDANRNAERNKIANAGFIKGRAEEVLPELMNKAGEGEVAGLLAEAGLAVVDPPRSGCDKAVLNCILGLPIKRLVYVSCNPASLARDLKFLCGEGFDLLEVQPIDMFAGSTHVECVVLMSRVED